MSPITSGENHGRAVEVYSKA